MSAPTSEEDNSSNVQESNPAESGTKITELRSASSRAAATFRQKARDNSLR